MNKEKAMSAEEQKLVEFMNDEKVVAKLQNIKKPEEAIALFQEHGIDMDEERLKAFLEAGIKSKETEGKELGEEALKQVTGGAYYYYSYSYSWSSVYRSNNTYYRQWYSCSYSWYRSWY